MGLFAEIRKWDLLDWIGNIVMPILIVLAALCVIAGIHSCIYPSPVLATLKKSDFKCTKAHSETLVRPQLVGKITIMVPTVTSVCDEYRRIK